jgi:predicted site-specific integrase-resolvase
MITLDEALVLAGVTSRIVHRWAEAGRIHYLETPSGCLLVCLDSLSKLALEQSEA